MQVIRNALKGGNKYKWQFHAFSNCITIITYLLCLYYNVLGKTEYGDCGISKIDDYS